MEVSGMWGSVVCCVVVSAMWGQWYGILTVCGVSGLFEVSGIFEVSSM